MPEQKSEQKPSQTPATTQHAQSPEIAQQTAQTVDPQRMASAPHARTTRDVLQLQRTVGNRAVGRMLQRTAAPNINRALDEDARKRLEAHIGSKARQQQLISSDKGGQGMAEALVREGRSDAIDSQQAAPGQTEQETISASLRRLVDFTRFDDSAAISVLARADQGGLSDADKWNVVKVNSDFLHYVQPGMTINKIIPPWTVETILDKKTMNEQFGNTVMGSVANKMNYDQGLTGEQSVSNFGLDYGGYTDVDDKGKSVKVKDSGSISPYVRERGVGRAGGAVAPKLVGVQNVFYVQLVLTATDMPNVRVPVHQNILDYATKLSGEISATLLDNAAIAKMAEEMGARDSAEVSAMLQKKLDIVNSFLANSYAPSNMVVAKKLSGAKQEQDPLTNLGITKPGSRLMNKFGTINQEYHLAKPVPLPAGSGLFLKDQTGKDKQVGTLTDVGGVLQWSNLRVSLIRAALHENKAM